MPPQTLPRKMLKQASNFKSLLRQGTALEIKFKASVVDGSRGRHGKISHSGDLDAEPRLPTDTTIGILPPPSKKQRGEIPPSLQDQFEEEMRERSDDGEKKRGGKSDDGYQNISGRKRCCIFNYKDFKNGLFSTRLGSNVSMQRLSESYRRLVFDVETYSNLTYDKTMNALERLREQCDEGDTKMIAITFMSHGDGTDPESFVTSDGRSISMNIVRNMFSNGNCKGLHGHPKLLFGFYCRNVRESSKMSSQLSRTSENAVLQHQVNGDDRDDSDIERALALLATENTRVVETRTETSSSSHDDMNADHSLSEMHRESSVRPRSRFFLEPDDLEDMITIYSSRPGTASYRHPKTGSVAEQCLSEVLDEYGKKLQVNAWYYHLQRKMKAKQTGHRLEYSFCPDRSDLMLKPCYLY